MSLNFFKTKPEKTNASLDYKSVLNDLKATDNTIPSLNIDQFIQDENILLGQHQDFYNEKKNDSQPVPKQLRKDTPYTAEDNDTRALVNSFIELSKSMPDIKAEAAECNTQVKALILQNKQTISKIDKASADLLK